MDEFRDRRPDTKRLEEGFDIRSIQHCLTQVTNFLMTKALFERRRQDKHNPTMLGNVSFHIEYNERTKETRLQFDKHPRNWNQQQITHDLLNIEAEMMMEKEALDGIQGMDNPFTY